MSASGLEAMFLSLWRGLGFPDVWEREHRPFPPRRFRFDFAVPDQRIAVEVDGGIYSGGRHVRGTGYERDCEKNNLAAQHGWRVFRVTAKMLHDDPVGHLGRIAEVLQLQGR